MVVDLTGIAVSIVGGVFSMLGLFITAEINSHTKDKAAAAVLNTAVENALGAIQQASIAGVKQGAPKVYIDGVPDNLTIGVQYVLDHAGEEATRFGITPELIADKINAAIGLRSLAIAHAQAVAAGTTPLHAVPMLAVPMLAVT